MDFLRLFYTGDMSDIRGETYTHLAYNGLDYTKAINGDDSDTLINEPLLQYMTNATNTVISPQFMDFIIDVGLFHKELDDKKPIDSSPIKSKIFNEIYKENKVPLEVKKFY